MPMLIAPGNLAPGERLRGALAGLTPPWRAMVNLPILSPQVVSGLLA
jgi:hypothetical protein